MLINWARFGSRFLTIDSMKESIVNFTKRVEELDYDIFYVYANTFVMLHTLFHFN